MALRKISQPVTALDGTENLDGLTTNGTYHQEFSRRADTELGYPVGQAGLLEVVNPTESSMVYQRYTLYNSLGMYFRGLYNASWGPWRKLLTE